MVSILGNSWHSVGIDEAHEMLINKECKTALSRPTPDQINRLTSYLPYRTKALENAKHQLFPERVQKHNSPESPFISETKLENNVITIIALVRKKSMLTITGKNRGVMNTLKF